MRHRCLPYRIKSSISGLWWVRAPQFKSTHQVECKHARTMDDVHGEEAPRSHIRFRIILRNMHPQAVVGKAHVLRESVCPCLVPAERFIRKRTIAEFDDVHQLSFLVLAVDRQNILHFRILQSVQRDPVLPGSDLPFNSSTNFSASSCNSNTRISCPLSEHILYDGLGFDMNSEGYSPQISKEQERPLPGIAVNGDISKLVSSIGRRRFS